MAVSVAKQFTKDFSELTTLLIGKFYHANTIEEVQVALSMMEDFAKYEPCRIQIPFVSPRDGFV